MEIWRFGGIEGSGLFPVRACASLPEVPDLPLLHVAVVLIERAREDV